MKYADAALPLRRIAVVRVALLIAFVLLGARAVQLTNLDARAKDLAGRQGNTTLTLRPERGTIFDRRGVELAISVDAPSVFVEPRRIEDFDHTSRSLARALGLRSSTVKRRLTGRKGFVFVSRWVTPQQAARVRALALPGVGLVSEPRRRYPQGALAAQLVGFANIDGRGVRGIEQLEDDWLRGTSLRLAVERDGSGRLLAIGDEEPWTTAGADVRLTLDAALQADALLALREAVEATGARGGIVISMDPSTGDVITLVETPSFDPNRFRELRYADTRSRAFLDALEPGSTFKAFLVAAALDGGSLTADDLIDCEAGEFVIPGKTIRDHSPHGPLRLTDILRVSSNIGAVKIAQNLGPRAHYEMLRRFGFGERTGSGFPDESAGLLRARDRWRPVDHATLAFGQGLSVTPIQMAAATAALANGGLWVRPRLVAARRAPRSPWQPTQSRVERRVIGGDTAALVLGMLETVTGHDGTGRRAALAGVRVAGKTGTAQKFDAALGRYSDDRFVAWFIGAVPAEAPRRILVVALDEPRRPTHTGGAAAAPLFARVAAAQLARLGILTEPQRPKPPSTRIAAAAPATAAPARPPQVEVVRVDDRILLPDFRGLTVIEVKRITNSASLAVEITGTGRAVEQHPPPGSVVAARDAQLRVRFGSGADAI